MLKTCKECGKDVSSKAKSCPNCGAARPKDVFDIIFRLIIASPFIYIFVVLSECSSQTPKDVITQQQTNKNPHYIGEWITDTYFKTGVRKVSETTVLPSEYRCDAAPQGSRYVVVDIVVENIDVEERMVIQGGALVVWDQGKKITYDPEHCTLGRGGFFYLDQVPPLLQKEGRVLFVLPYKFNVQDMFYKVPRGDALVKLQHRPQ